MKKHINPFRGLVLLALALTPFLSIAKNGNPKIGENIEKKRTISKTYNVSSDERLSIENSYGDVTVATWDKNVIQVDIEIAVRASTDDKAGQMMDQINVADEQSGKEISFRTHIGNMGNDKGKDKDKSSDGERKYHIDYKISMPSGNPLRVENSFGKVVIPDFLGNASLTSKFGELIAGNLSNAKLVNVEFGKAEVGQLKNADVVFKYNGKSNIAGLSGTSKVDVQFCGQVNISIDSSVTQLSLFQSYSSVDLKVTNNLSAQFDVYTNFGSFKNKTGFNIAEEKEDESSGPKFDKNYSGLVGAGAAKIKIKASFGSVLVANVNDKSVDKSKDEDKDDDDDKKVKM